MSDYLVRRELIVPHQSGLSLHCHVQKLKVSHSTTFGSQDQLWSCWIMESSRWFSMRGATVCPGPCL